MEVVLERCAGLDVHKDVVVACVRVMLGRKVEQEVRRFETRTRGLLELLDWLEERGVTHVGMEATGVYWKPVWEVLEGAVEVVLANAAHIKAVPGRKSDVNDATWIAELLAHGLIRASFVPPVEIQDLRDLTRTRKQLGREIVQHAQRIDRVLTEANVRLTSVVSELLGASGRRIVRALADGETDPEKLAELGSEQLKCGKDELKEALRGRVRAHHRFMLAQHLATIEHLEARIRAFEERIEEVLRPFRDVVERLKGIPGVSEVAADVLVAEIGVDMSRFATSGHLLSWAGLCPRMDESAGKRRDTRVRDGAPWLKPTLVQCGWSATRKNGTYLQAQFLRLRARRGPKKAVMAVAASILTAAYHIIKDGAEYRDLGPDHFVRRDRTKLASRLAKRIKELGYEVQIRKVAA